MSVEIALYNVAKTVGEGPHWDDNTQTLIFVDIFIGDLYRYNPSTGKFQSVRFDKSLGAAVPCKKGGYLLGLGRTISHFDWDTRKITKLHEVENSGTSSRMNDAKCDPSGRFWTGTVGFISSMYPLEFEDEKGALFCADVNGKVTQHLDKRGITNGMAWTKDKKTMFFIDSTPRTVYKFDYDDSTGNIANQKVLIDFNTLDESDRMGSPDGMTIDTDDNLWVACYNGAKVVCMDSNTGKILREVMFPAKRITSCCFGGKDLDELYVTSAVDGAMGEEMKAYPQSGSLFRVKGLGVKGYAANVYEGPVSL